METFETHLAEVYSHYESGDHSLALRRLTDCAIETRSTGIFSEVLSYYEWLDRYIGMPDQPLEESRQKAFNLLEKIGNAGVKKGFFENSNDKILSVIDVNKTYQKSGFTISDVNFEMYERQITGLVGENGNGKTTLLRLLSAELKPDGGSIYYHFAKDATDMFSLRTKLIYIEQRIPKWYGSLMDNLRFVLPFYGLKGDDDFLWAEIMVARLGLRPYRDLSWDRISSGYRTRFELAKTLLRNPKILLLDEPLANLDINSQQTILQDLKFMANSISAPFGMVLSSQHIYEVEKVSDKIIFIKDGKPLYEKRDKETTAEETSDQVIFEMETKNTREELIQAFSNLKLEKIQFNGGVYLLYFSGDTSINQVLESMALNKIEPGYFRNISQSSRRFFIN